MSTAGLGATFRDPAGSVVFVDGRVYRLVRPEGSECLRSFIHSRTGHELVSSGKVVSTTVLSGDERDAAAGHAIVRSVVSRLNPEMICEHERIAFSAYPYEWCPEMLHAAGLLTIELARKLLAEGLGLKDATPYNVLFRGPDPVFVDVLSFEPRHPLDPLWLPHAQFMRTFVLPLLANKYYGLSMADVFLSRRDGLEPEEVYRWTRLHERIRPPFLSAVTLPAWLGGSRQVEEDIYKPKRLGDAEKARFVLERLLLQAENLLRKLEPRADASSNWSDYTTTNNNYSSEQSDAKRRFVAAAVREIQPGRVLDVGCNTGEYSFIAAEQGVDVVAIDYDPVVIGRLWRRSKAARARILPLVVNLSRPSPATGWRNEECASFMNRAAGSFDLVLMLAVMHHMLVTDRIPLPQIVETAASLTRDWAMIEFVGPRDSMFRRLTRGRDHLHADVSSQLFEHECRPFFDIVRTLVLPEADRSLYLLRKKRFS